MGPSAWRFTKHLRSYIVKNMLEPFYAYIWGIFGATGWTSTSTFYILVRVMLYGPSLPLCPANLQSDCHLDLMHFGPLARVQGLGAIGQLTKAAHGVLQAVAHNILSIQSRSTITWTCCCHGVPCLLSKGPPMISKLPSVEVVPQKASR